MSLSFYPQIRGWNRVFADGSGRVRRGNRGVRHQPFLLPSGPIWDWHPRMKPCRISSSSSSPVMEPSYATLHIAAPSECCCCLSYKPPLCSRHFEQASPACLIQSLILEKNKHMMGLFSCWLAFGCRNTPAAATTESARPDANSWRGFTTFQKTFNSIWRINGWGLECDRRKRRASTYIRRYIYSIGPLTVSSELYLFYPKGAISKNLPPVLQTN